MTDDPPAFLPAVPEALPERLTVDSLFDVMADRRRRQVLGILLEREHAIEVEELARSLAAREMRDGTVPSGDRERSGSPADRDGRKAPPGERVRLVHRLLYHVHLPKLADAGLIEYDGERGTVARTEAAEQVGIPFGPEDDTACESGDP